MNKRKCRKKNVNKKVLTHRIIIEWASQNCFDRPWTLMMNCKNTKNKTFAKFSKSSNALMLLLLLLLLLPYEVLLCDLKEFCKIRTQMQNTSWRQFLCKCDANFVRHCNSNNFFSAKSSSTTTTLLRSRRKIMHFEKKEIKIGGAKMIFF